MSCVETASVDPSASSTCIPLVQGSVEVTVEVLPNNDMSHIRRVHSAQQTNRTNKPRHWQPENIHYLHQSTISATPHPAIVQSVRISSSSLSTSLLYSPYGVSVDYTKAPFGARAVCTVQTFRNDMSGPMLYLFIRHHLALGWVVIIFDRYGWHEEDVAPFLRTDERVIYYPYTLFQYYFPDIYNKAAALQQVL